MIEKISEALNDVENEHNIRIIYACESGSRAWGFASLDSDFDVRFIYVHSRDWYLSIAEKRDVIELPADDLLDVNGWDIRKTLRLLRRSNSPLMEWLISPIKYLCMDSAFNPLLALSKKAFLPDASFYHYLSMFRNSIVKIQDSEKPGTKAYLYALRPLLCCKWIRLFGGQPPMHINELLSALLPNASEIRSHIDALIEMKIKGSEKESISRLPVIEDYLISQLSEIANFSPGKSVKEDLESFDKVFRKILEAS